MKALGIEDSREKAALYLRRVLGNRARWDLIDAFLDAAPEMTDYMHAHTSLRLVPRVIGPDYYSEEEGAMPGGRMLDPAIYDGRKLGRSEEHTSELQSIMRNSYAVFCLQKKTQNHT